MKLRFSILLLALTLTACGSTNVPIQTDDTIQDIQFSVDIHMYNDTNVNETREETIVDVDAEADIEIPVCIFSTPCVTNADCVSLSGTHCNTALNPPKCQLLYCGDIGTKCSENALCANRSCINDECSDETCEAECTGLECGNDPVCGTSCGSCANGFVCESGSCVDDACVPNCGSRVCGNDPVCGTSCGSCANGFVCESGSCVDDACVPNCGSRVCGNDPVCGTSCGSCANGFVCESGSCVDDACVPNCGSRVCGNDPVCGTSCGTCSNGYVCQSGSCVVVSTCTGDDAGSCKAFFGCLDGCNDEACQTGCQSNMSSQGLADYEITSQCLYTTCGGIDDQNAWYSCLNENCTDALLSCFWGCTYETCLALNYCVYACPDDNPGTTVNEYSECSGDCGFAATKQAQRDKTAVYDCMMTACPVCKIANPTPTQVTQCDTCWDNSVEGTCATQWAPCLPPPGTKSCKVTFTCINTCTGNGCQQACYDNGTTQAQTLFMAIQTCLNNNCDPDLGVENWSTCANAAIATGGACRSQYTSCINDA